MSYISDQTPEQELSDLHDHLVGWVQTQEKRLKILTETVNIRDRKLDSRERMLNEKEKILNDKEATVTGNSY
ncbi:hypothetical protein LCGC14_2677110 [marine sediment metagenome]|uniref:Uncharacterized protein n=1 Tax=marine sediment metagenome TaxID=412755 RepID=A0A0F9CE85_9ZZZZ